MFFLNYRFNIEGNSYVAKMTHYEALIKTRAHFKGKEEHLKTLNKYYD